MCVSQGTGGMASGGRSRARGCDASVGSAGVWRIIHAGRGKGLSMLSFSFVAQHSVRTHFLLGDIFICQSSDCEEFTSEK